VNCEVRLDSGSFDAGLQEAVGVRSDWALGLGEIRVRWRRSGYRRSLWSASTRQCVPTARSWRKSSAARRSG
jgi:hypothetical protein